MKALIIYFVLPVFLLSLFGCNEFASSQNSEEANKTAASIPSAKFNAYWYQGKAEVASYKLEQARYGEIHEGTAVMIFVTEDFSRSRHVKVDNPSLPKNDLAKILKLNFTKKFNTGIYPYSMMQSVFTPVHLDQFAHSLKTTASIQEWCGQMFVQLDLRDDQYEVQQFSYFENEGDKKVKLKAAFLEDELWNRIRIAPKSLPTGAQSIIPGSFYLRLKHQPLQPQKAELLLTEKDNFFEYQIKYPEIERTLLILFEKEFPYQVVSWEETYKSGWGKDAKILTTKAKLVKSLFIDYWTKNKKENSDLRDTLGLD